MTALQTMLVGAALLCGALVLCAQAPQWQWAASAGGVDLDHGQAIAADSQGNQYVTGYFEDFATFGAHNLTASGYTDIFVAKLDPYGNWLWAVKAGELASGQGQGIAVDGAGNSYLTGYFTSTAAFGGHTLTTSGGKDVFAAKLDPEGNWLWAAAAGGAGDDQGFGIAVDSAGNAWLAGSFIGTAAFGSHSLSSSGSKDIFAAKLDSAGNFLWAASAGGLDYDTSHGIAADSAGNAYLTGSFFGTATFGPHTLSSGGSGDIFAAKLGPTGNWLWAVRAGGPSIASGVDITVNGSGTAWLTGLFYGTASFGSHSVSSSGSYDAFAAKLVYSTPVDDGLIPEANTRTRLHNAWPNPFHRGESALIKADVASGETGILRIFNLRGQCLQSHELGPGPHQIRLDSQNLPGGIYLYNLQTGLLSETKKLVLLK